jgi:DNA-binding CsgD family transcriptional regulator
MVCRLLVLNDSGNASKNDYLDFEQFCKNNKLTPESTFAVMQNLSAFWSACPQELSIEIRVYLSQLDYGFVRKQTEAAMQPPPTPNEFEKLNNTEKAISLLTAMNYTQSEISDKIIIAADSVNTLRKRIYKKLNIRGNVHSLRDYMIMQGWLKLDVNYLTTLFPNLIPF